MQFDTIFLHNSHDKKPCHLYGAEYLLRLLLILPDILTSSGIPKEKRTVVLSVLNPLALFILDNANVIFSNNYSTGNNDIVLQENVNTNNNKIVEESDRHLLTEFTQNVFQHVSLCYALQKDIVGKRRSMKVGWPGLQCRWCSGNNSSSSNTFYSANAESMAAVPR